jgi:Reverse transcriptase (RNA-dependent DNA polymerase)
LMWMCLGGGCLRIGPHLGPNQMKSKLRLLNSLKPYETRHHPCFSGCSLQSSTHGTRVDFRALNDCTLDSSWPIPNIAEMLRRIGAQKCKNFGVMDLTQGYHQAPLDPDSICFTAFILFCGVYEFTRLSFGPKRAPSYFQEQMATVVLAGLIYSMCEIYIDDCNVFAQTDDEFGDRLRQIFTRFRKHNMFLKAQKMFFWILRNRLRWKSFFRKGAENVSRKNPICIRLSNTRCF